jgi:RNA polymerase sigma-70 factor (ECF subfamily)
VVVEARARPIVEHTTESPVEASSGQLVDFDERRLLPRHCSGDPNAFPELLAAYRAPVYSCLIRHGVEAGMRDDLFQEIFLKVHRAAPNYQPSRPLRPWLFTIVANTVRNHFRDRRDHELALAEGTEANLHHPGPDAEEIVEAKETAARLERAIARLPLPQREVVVLTCIEGLGQKEVAAALQIPVNTVKTYLRRARLRLARALPRRGDDEGPEQSA